MNNESLSIEDSDLISFLGGKKIVVTGNAWISLPLVLANIQQSLIYQSPSFLIIMLR